jgi:tetratricopeptide (TPR) repeat protein
MSRSANESAFDAAVVHHRAGRLAEAEKLYQQILNRDPNHALAAHQLAMIAHQTGRNEIAIDFLRRAIAPRPNWPEAHSNLGNILRIAGQIDQSITACRRALELRPDYPHALNNLALALIEKGELDEAIAACRRAIALNPHFAEAHNNLGNALQRKNQPDDAIVAHLKAISINPKIAEFHHNLGIALQDKQQLEQAISAYCQAITLNPDYTKAHVNLANALREQGRPHDAIEEFRRVLDLQPDFAEVHTNLAMALLSQGIFEQGWQEYEWRWKCEDFSSRKRDFLQPIWDGSPFAGRTLLLHAEQGIGDGIQFIRFLPRVKRLGGNVLIECHPSIYRLLNSIAEGCRIVPSEDPLPPFDLHCPLLSLPRVFSVTLQTIPAIVPYLQPDANDVRVWQERFARYSNDLRVGLVWSGNPTHKNDRNRSISPASFAPFANVPGITFFSLQKGPAAAETKNPPPGLKITDWTEDLPDFAATAALISNLDLVVTVDTAVAHLAGAIGKPVWTLLPFVPDWRWLWNRTDTPWYPTMRLFRQPARGDWNSVIALVADELRLLSSGR